MLCFTELRHARAHADGEGEYLGALVIACVHHTHLASHHRHPVRLRQTLDGMHTQGDRHRLRAATPESKAQFLRGLLSRRFGRGAAYRHAAPKLRVASERQIERDGLLRVRL